MRTRHHIFGKLKNWMGLSGPFDGFPLWFRWLYCFTAYFHFEHSEQRTILRTPLFMLAEFRNDWDVNTDRMITGVKIWYRPASWTFVFNEGGLFFRNVIEMDVKYTTAHVYTCKRPTLELG